MKRFMVLLLSILMISTLLVGCQGPSKHAVYDKDTPAMGIPSQTLAANSRFELRWDAQAACILLTDLSMGKVWATTPYEYFMDGGMSANLNSSIKITVANSTTLQQETVAGYTGVMENGRIFTQTVPNGIRITYCFDVFEISVPVIYVLREDSLTVTVDTSGIQEGESFRLVSVSVAPYMCSVNNETEGAYLFVPSGSGALMYAAENADGTRRFSGEVYGTDAARILPERVTEEEAIRLPVFGAKDGEQALFGIIEQGAGAAVLEAEAGNSRTGYSNIYPTFFVRGYDIYESQAAAFRGSDVTRLSENISDVAMTVAYYPLSGEDADYNGMARQYRQVIQARGLFTSTQVKQQPYSVTLVGGVQISSTLLGIPHKATKAITTFSQGQAILQELIEKTKILPAVRLVGYGDSGISPGKLAGDFSFDSLYGGENQRIALEDYCKQIGIDLFTDFDVIRFSNSGNGFSTLLDAAKTASLHAAEQYPVSVPLRSYQTDAAWKILQRGQLSKAVDKLITMADELGMSGLSVSTLGETAYSDYSDPIYATKGAIEKDVSELIQMMRSAGHSVAVSSANTYAALAADCVFEVPDGYGDYIALDVWIPFYEMVFSQERPLYSSAINVAANIPQQVMRTLAGGIGLGFMLIHDYDVSLTELTQAKLYAARYADNKMLIEELIEKYGAFYTATAEARIQRYDLLDGGVSRTEFDNGITLYANHNSTPAASPAGVLEAYGVIWGSADTGA